jgi:hypothetical protein
VIRFISLLNVAVWLGATVFFTFGAGPAIFSDEMAALLPKPHRGRVAEIVIARLIVLQQICGGVALLLLFVDFLRTGRWAKRLVLGVVAGAFLLSLTAGSWLAPRMHALQQVRYSTRATPQQQAAAERAFKAWHGASQVANVLVLAGLVYLLWRVSVSSDSQRRGPPFRPAPPSPDGSVPRML